MTWLQTVSGKPFDLLEPKPEDVDFNDIAWALAHICRYAGHVPAGIYSVAQHCVLGADYLNDRNGPQAALCFLLHDAHEAYMGDITAPIMRVLGKRAQMAIDNLKARLDSFIYQAVFGATAEDIFARWGADVHDIDLRMLATERKYLLAHCDKSWGEKIDALKPLPIEGQPRLWSINHAKDLWLHRFHAYRHDLGIA